VCWQARHQADTSSHAGVIEASAEHLSSRSSTPHFARSSQALDPRGYRARSAHLSVTFVRASSRASMDANRVSELFAGLVVEGRGYQQHLERRLFLVVASSIITRILSQIVARLIGSRHAR
jgi:hypothetical protein